MKLLFALFDLFRKGSVVANPEAWKYGQITATVLGAFLWSVARTIDTFGYTLPLDQSQVDQLAAGLLTVINVVLTVVTSDKVGLPARPDRDEPGRPALDRAGDDTRSTDRRTDFGGA